MERKNDIRKEILFQLYGVRPLSLSAARIARDCRKGGYDYTPDEIKSELQFLEDEKLIIGEREPGTTGKVFRIHALGVSVYEEKYAA